MKWRHHDEAVPISFMLKSPDRDLNELVSAELYNARNGFRLFEKKR